jgi:MOSC domain-containing protein YiiM
MAGSLGENLTTRGVDYRRVRIGDAYRVGDHLLLQITKPRVPCRTISVYGANLLRRLWGSHVPWGESGFYARVLEPGPVRPGDVVSLERPGPAPPPATTRKVERGGDDAPARAP